ncbi:MAG TPA: site-specific integrase [Elusimicrobiota bacterium]|nr:site-specific integrase [Elusimicrobiota bacterium]
MAIIRKGENWFIDYRANGRRIREKVGPNRKLAESVLAKRKLDLAENKFLDVRKVSRETFHNFSKTYLDWVQGRIRSIVQERIYVRRLNETFGDLALSDIDVARAEKFMAQRLKEPRHHPYTGRAAWKLSEAERQAKIAAWYAGNSKTISKSHVNREVSCLHRIMNKAADWKLIPANPLRGIKLYDEREFIRKRYLKPEEIRTLLAACSPHIKEIVTFALYTGRRFGEIAGMRWQDVDLENGYVYFPKTKKKEPDQVVLPPRARELLKTMRETAGEKGESVFHRRDGGPMRDVRFGFKRALRVAGIKGFRFHDLRHTAISYMMMNGIDLKTIAELVGHTTAEMVDKRYGHLSPDHKRIAAEIFGSAMDRLCGYEGVAEGGAKLYKAGSRKFQSGHFLDTFGKNGAGQVESGIKDFVYKTNRK